MAFNFLQLMAQKIILNTSPERIEKIFELLKKDIPNSKIALDFSNPLELLIATILSAQCTDDRVNIVTKTLFKKYTSAKDFATVKIGELEQDIRSTGFYHNKAKNIQNTCKLLIEKYHGEVPSTMEELLELHGVARKTANIVLHHAFGIIEGIAVDTHVKRVSFRLGLTKNTDPEKIEQDLMKVVPKKLWVKVNDLLIWHGRKTCDARKPLCEQCVLLKTCPRNGLPALKKD